MPYTQEQKERFLAHHGVTSDEYDVIESEGSVTLKPRPKAQPTASIAPPAQQETTADSSTAGAFGRGAVTSVAPAVGSIPFAWGGAKVGGVIGSPFGPVGTAIGAGIGAIGGAIYGGYKLSQAQEQLLTDNFKQQLNVDREQHPYASTAGNLAGSLVALRPDPKAIVGAGRAIRGAMMQGERLHPADVGNLINVGSGAGLGAGLSIYDNLSNGQAIDPTTLAMNTLGGALINNPRNWTRKLGATPNVYPEVISDAPMQLPDVARLNRDAGITSTADPETVANAFIDSERAKEPLMKLSRDGVNLRTIDKALRRVDPTHNWRGNQEVTTAELSQLEGEGGPAINEELLAERKHNLELKQAKLAKIQEENAALQAELDNSGQVTPRFQPAEFNLSTSDLATNDKVANKLHSSHLEAGNPHKLRVAAKLKNGTVVEGKLGEHHYQLPNLEEGADFGFVQPDGTYLNREDAANLSRYQPSTEVTTADAPSENLYTIPRNLSKLIRKEGVTPEMDSSLSNPATGAAVRGRADIGMPDRPIKINPDIATTDTIPHEIGHHDIVEMLESPSTANIAKKWLMTHGWDGKSTDATDANYRRAEEALIQRAGKAFDERSNESSSFKRFAKDLKASIKSRIGAGNGDDTARLMANKLENDPVYSVRQELEGIHPARIKGIPAEEDIEARYASDAEKEAFYRGKQQGWPAKGIPDIELYNLNKDIKDPQNDKVILYPKGSTVSEDTLKQYGVRYQPKEAPVVNKRLTELEAAEDTRNLTVQEEDELRVLRLERDKPQRLFRDMRQAVKDAPETVSRYQDGIDKDDASPFMLTSQKLLKSEKPNVMNLFHHSNSKADNQAIRARLAKSIPEAEYNILKQAGIEDYLSKNGKTSKAELEKWINENAPKIEVVKKGAGVLSETHKAYNKMKHEWFDSLDQYSNDTKTINDMPYKWESSKLRDWLEERNVSPKNVDKAVEYAKLQITKENEVPTNKSNWQSVAPKSENEMQDYVELAVVLPLGSHKAGSEGVIPEPRPIITNQPKFPSSHSFPPNTISWVRGYMEGDTFRIIEVQSDWAAEVNKFKEKVKENGGTFELTDGTPHPTQAAKKVSKLNDPHLEYYETLAVKAAIKHALDNGAKKIAVDDSQTAMLTEGHDRAANHTLLNAAEIRKAIVDKDIFEETIIDGIRAGYINDKGAIIFNKGGVGIGYVNGKGEVTSYREDGIVGTIDVIPKFDKVISQKDGMVQHYDLNLPNILKKLTGDNGTIKEFGEHKSAMENREDSRYDDLRSEEILALKKTPRKDLIFKNADGTPKTISTARTYDLAQVASKLNMPEHKGKFSTIARFQEAADSGTPAKTDKPDRFLSIFGSATDKVRNVGTASFKHVGDTFDKWSAKYSLNKGEYVNKLQSVMDEYTPEQRQRVDEFGRKMMLTNGKDDGGIKLDDQEKALHQHIRDYLINVADVNEAREIKKNPHYWPAVISTDAVHALVNNTAESTSIRNAFIAHAKTKGVTRTEAITILNDYVAALGSRGHGNDLSFGALRKVAGIGLPESMQDNNLLSRFTRYGSRVAKDLASQQVLEKDPVMQYVLHMPDSATGKRVTEPPKLPDGTTVDESVGANPKVQDVLKFMYNDFNELNQPVLKAASKLLHASIMGPATAMRNIASTPLNSLASLNELKDVKHVVGGLIKMFDADIWKRSFEANARQKNMNNLEFGASENPNKVADMLNKSADFMRKWSGREASEQGERIFEFAIGDLAARQKLLEATKGNEKAKEWLLKHGTLVDNIDELIAGKSEATQQDIDKIAKSFVDRVSGTYDARGLPAGAMEGQFAPFLALSRWSIEKSNVIYKDVIQEATLRNNFMPLISYTMGALLTGEGIRQLNELMSGKREQEANLSEATAMGNKEAQVKAVVNLLQMASYAGVVSDLTKAAINPSKARGLSFPLADFITETLGRNITDATIAMGQGEDKFEVVVDMLGEIAKGSVQGMRLAAGHIDKKGTEEKNRFRNVRVFNELEGKPVSADYAQPNKFIGKDEKAFKKETDPAKAASELREILKDYFARYADNPEELRKKLASLKANNYQTMPSPERVPATFIRYLNYVKKTQGEQKAQELFADYLMRNQVNKVKSSMVPQI